MAMLEQERPKIQAETLLPTVAAEQYISLLQDVVEPNEEQQAMLAAAHYTLCTERNLSCNQSKMHINAAIALLKRIDISNQNKHWCTQIAHAYFKRAEILEEKDQFIEASKDYLKAIEILDRSEKHSAALDDEDHVLLAQSAISIADLIVSEQVEDDQKHLSHPLFYVNKALEGLAKTSKTDDKVYSTYAYAHQIAGIALSSFHFEEAKEAFRIALVMAFKTETTRISLMLADIYTCLGMLYEERSERYPIEKSSENLLEHAVIYFGLAQLLTPPESDESEDMFEELTVLENLFEMIYRVLDPFLVSLSYQVTCDLIDVLIYIYMCFIDRSLLNQSLDNQLGQSDILDTYAQHIYLLVLEAYQKKYTRSESYNIIEYSKADFKLNSSDIMDVIQNMRSNNIYYFPTKEEVI